VLGWQIRLARRELEQIGAVGFGAHLVKSKSSTEDFEVGRTTPLPEASDPSSLPSDEVTPVETPRLKSILALQVGVVVVAGLYLGREVLIPITLAVLLSFVLAPLANLLRRLRLGRVASVLVAVALAIGIVILIGAVIGSQVASLATRLPEYTGTIETKIQSVRAVTIDRVSGLLDQLGSKSNAPSSGASNGRPVERGSSSGPSKDAGNASQESAASPIALAERYLSPVLSPLATLGIVIVVSIFILLQREDLRDRMIRLFGSADLHRTTIALDDAARRLSKYFVTQLSINAAFATILSIGLFFIGVPNFLLWGIFSGLLRFVPYVGAFISAALPIALAAAVDPGWSMALWTAALYIVAELLVSQALEPFLYGHSTGLSPFAVVVSAIFWSWLWGPIGLILSTPMTLCLVVLGRHVERFEFLDILLGDRAPLTPVESFYQRILAGDVDEAQDLAEGFLKENSLSAYYDEVAIKGMQMAAHDSERGVLREKQLQRVRNTLKALISELSIVEDADPGSPPRANHGSGIQTEKQVKTDPVVSENKHSHDPERWPDHTETPILCLAGRGPLDEAASSMLAQLLEKHGFRTIVAPYAAASRETIARLEAKGVRMVCISYLEVSGNPPHLRYTIRRLRQKLPGSSILVGLWPATDAALTDQGMRAQIGADYYARSLQEAVDLCTHTNPKDEYLSASSLARGARK
jgi:predicted PurR-regulated permease PerM